MSRHVIKVSKSIVGDITVPPEFDKQLAYINNMLGTTPQQPMRPDDKKMTFIKMTFGGVLADLGIEPTDVEVIIE